MGLIKCCYLCGNNFESTAKKNKKKARCQSCRNKVIREKWYANQIAKGREPFRYQNMVKSGLKECPKCNCVKPLKEFASRNGGKTIRTECKMCEAAVNKAYELKNREAINANRRRRRADPIRGIIFTQRDRQRSLFKQSHSPKTKPQTKMIREWLGATVQQCKDYIEAQFLEGMTWENRGVGKDRWQIDHKIPVSFTQIDNAGEIIDNERNRKIWHYTNLQPLWHEENSAKSNRYVFTEEFYVAC